MGKSLKDWTPAGGRDSLSRVGNRMDWAEPGRIRRRPGEGKVRSGMVSWRVVRQLGEMKVKGREGIEGLIYLPSRFQRNKITCS